MNQVTRDDVIRMVQAVEKLHDAVGQFSNECGLQPSPNSQAASELNTFQRPESLRTAYSQGNILIEVAADQLIAFTKTVTEPVQTVAPWSCLRAIVESCALATWLLDPNLDARTRVQRSFAFRYDGLIEEVKFARASGNKPGISKVTARINEVERDALRLGFPRVEDKNKVRRGIAQHMPSITDIIIKTLDEEAIYRVTSAMTHAHPWALQQLSFRRVKKEEYPLAEDIDSISDVHLFEKHLEPFSVALLCSKAANVFSKPVIYKGKLFGWDTERLKNIFDAFSSLNIQ